MGCKQSKLSADAVAQKQQGPSSRDTTDTTNSLLLNPQPPQLDDAAAKSQGVSSAKKAHSFRLTSKKKDTSSSSPTSAAAATSKKKSDTVYNLLAQACSNDRADEGGDLGRESAPATNSKKKPATSSLPNNNNDIQQLLAAVTPAVTPDSAAYSINGATPLHMAVQLLDRGVDTSDSADALLNLVSQLLKAHPDVVRQRDAAGHIPLHYAVAPEHANNSKDDNSNTALWKSRASIVRLLVAADSTSCSKEYLGRNNVPFADDTTTTASCKMSRVRECSPLYRALQCLPDDSTDPRASGGVPSPTFEYIQLLLQLNASTASVGNASDGDKPLALLYRRFTRQFDLAEQFFPGDNSRTEIVQHRHRYTAAAGNTWKLIELLLHYSGGTTNNNNTIVVPKKWSSFRAVHRAVQGETPPDLLRYIVETNAHDLALVDEAGNLPLHYAAQSKPPNNNNDNSCQSKRQHFPAFYSKYVMDELLYKFPEAAAVQDAQGRFPLTLAVEAGKQWIGGGLKSLYDAYPEAMQQVDLGAHPVLQRALSMVPMSDYGTDKEEKMNTPNHENDDTVQSDEPHDAIMLVQQPDVDVSEVVTSMWAHEEDAGVQMLGCVAISRLLSQAAAAANHSSNDNSHGVLPIALTAVPAVVNSMKAHPNEVIVQEKACQALHGLAPADGRCEISFVASGAVAAIVGAMQAHVSDPGVQEQACCALQSILQQPATGADRATVVASVSGMTALVNALAAHPQSEMVQIMACRALQTLMSWSPHANLPDLPRQQVEPLLELAQARFPESCGSLVQEFMSLMMTRPQWQSQTTPTMSERHLQQPQEV